MAKWNDVVITDMGMQLSAQTLAGKKIVYTHAQTTDLDLSGKTPDQIQAMTELTSVKQDIPISSISVNDKETVKIFVKITNEGVKQDYMLYGLAVFAKIDDNPEVLYEVVTAQKPDLVPALTGTTLSGINFSLLTHVAKSENASIVVGAGGLNEDEVLELINDHTIDLSDYVTQQQLATKVTDLNNGLNAKVTDNHDGTEQLNGVKVHPFNKLSDTIGGRNYLTNTANPTMSNPIQLFGEVAGIAGKADYSAGVVKLTTVTSGETYYRFSGGSTRMPLQAGETYTLSYTISGTDGLYLGTRIIFKENIVSSWEELPISYHKCTTKSMNYKDTFTVPDTALSLIVSVQVYAGTNKNNDNTGTNSVSFSNVMLEKGEVQHDWTPAPEDKVNVSDMRKPANQVASIDEVNAKQDKLDYTPANAANVVARNPDTGVVSEPVDFTKLTVNGGKSVATSDDLKSVADKAWYQLDNKYITPASGYTLAPSTSILYKIDDSTHTLYLSGSIVIPDYPAGLAVTVQLGSIIKSILTVSVVYIGNNSNYNLSFLYADQSSTNLTFIPLTGVVSLCATSGAEGSLSYITYDELI
ncbi:scaffold protein [Lactobacillus phage 3-SAC12]|nr:scaffold protein [Lactobacillus phage 3-SAC12]